MRNLNIKETVLFIRNGNCNYNYIKQEKLYNKRADKEIRIRIRIRIKIKIRMKIQIAIIIKG